MLLRRRIGNGLLTILVVTALVLIVQFEQTRLRSAAFITGYTLLAALLFLALYNLRKKLTFLPLGNSATWLQAHIHVGLGSILVFLLHGGLRLPDGILERALAALFVIVAGSGIYGLYQSRTVPKRLTAVGNEVIFERIPTIRRRVSDQAHAVCIGTREHPGSLVIAQFYARRLFLFFEGPRVWHYYLFPTSSLRRRLLQEISDLRRYLSSNEQVTVEELTRLVSQKDDLDYHFALQGRLKIWLFAHVGFTYSLVTVALLHTILVHWFHGGTR